MKKIYLKTVLAALGLMMAFLFSACKNEADAPTRVRPENKGVFLSGTTSRIASTSFSGTFLLHNSSIANRLESC